MLKNLIVVAIRNFKRQVLFTGINVAGLSVGIASALLILLYVLSESSFDNFHSKTSQIYRVNQTDIWSSDGGKMPYTMIPLAETLNDEIPQISESVRIDDWSEQLVTYESDNFYADRIFGVDENFFSFFDYTLLKGHPDDALTGLNKVVLTEKTADRLFGNEDPIDKLISIEDKVMTVTGIVEDPPLNSHFQFDYLVSINSNPAIKEFEWSWIYTTLITYVKLEKGAKPEELTNTLSKIGPKYVPPSLQRLNMSYESLVGDKGGYNFYIQPLQEIYLDPDLVGNPIGPVGSKTYVYVFSSIGIMILILGCINFINLSTARSSLRAKEVGMRKVMGSSRKYLVWQFLFESIFLTALATVIGIGLAEIFKVSMLHSFNITFLYGIGDLLQYIIAFPLVLGVFAGFYPALYLTSFKPSSVLKGNISSGFRGSKLRSTLVVIQFMIALVLFTSTIFLYDQLKFLINKDPGFNEENILVIDQAERLGEKLHLFENSLRSNSSIKNTAVAMNMPGDQFQYEDIFKKYGTDQKVMMSIFKNDEDYFKTLNFQLVAGDRFRDDVPGDYNKVIINEAAAEAFGWNTESAVGKFLEYTGDELGKVEITGVVDDFHYQSLQQTIGPVIFIHHQSSFWGDSRVVAVKFEDKDLASVLSFAESQWKKYSDTPLQYFFLDKQLEKYYTNESQLSRLFSILSVLAIFISTIGIAGLSAFATEKRHKEISVRKILGAEVKSLLILFSKDYLKLAFIALVLAVPLIYWGISSYLQNYAYSIDHSLQPYATAFATVTIIAISSASYFVVKASMVNPSLILKDD